jgi:hypothetical protein
MFLESLVGRETTPSPIVRHCVVSNFASTISGVRRFLIFETIRTSSSTYLLTWLSDLNSHLGQNEMFSDELSGGRTLSM